MPEKSQRSIKWNPNTFMWIIAVYIAVIVLCGVYIFALQGFGAKGLVFSIGGKNQVIDAFDIILLAAAVASFFLVAISLLAFKRRKDNRIFILSIAFFLFAVNEILQIFDNFFPNEFIFIANAQKVLDLLILLSFAMLVYGRYTRR
jgi:hypothetical protein